MTGHTAVVVGNKMFVMMGYSPTMSFSPDVQEFNLGMKNFAVFSAKDLPILGMDISLLTLKGAISREKVYCDSKLFALVFNHLGIKCFFLLRQSRQI